MRVDFLLKGIVFGNDGRALSPFHSTKKGGRCYRYDIPQRDVKEYARTGLRKWFWNCKPIAYRSRTSKSQHEWFTHL
jgi:hypothetical protein